MYKETRTGTKKKRKVGSGNRKYALECNRKKRKSAWGVWGEK